QVVIQAGVVTPEGIAVDWVARNLYFSDRVQDKIMVSTLTGRHMKTLLDNLGEPRALVVDPSQGLYCRIKPFKKVHQ
ncbi:predicted protein, partial [Nematostella vectensis]